MFLVIGLLQWAVELASSRWQYGSVEGQYSLDRDSWDLTLESIADLLNDDVIAFWLMTSQSFHRPSYVVVQSEAVVELTDENYNEVLKTRFVFVNFYKPWWAALISQLQLSLGIVHIVFIYHSPLDGSNNIRKKVKKYIHTENTKPTVSERKQLTSSSRLISQSCS